MGNLCMGNIYELLNPGTAKAPTDFCFLFFPPMFLTETASVILHRSFLSVKQQ